MCFSVLRAYWPCQAPRPAAAVHCDTTTHYVHCPTFLLDVMLGHDGIDPVGLFRPDLCVPSIPLLTFPYSCYHGHLRAVVLCPV
jgi:hypothetical protein